jgi:hypothetical protein
MKLRIVSDGKTTSILDDNGVDITEYVYAVEWRHAHGKPPEGLITFRAVALDVFAEVRLSTEVINVSEDLNGKIT